MNFALYCSDWTEMSINYKKLMLLTNRMNNAEKLQLKITLKKVVNLELFASVCIFCQSYFSTDLLVFFFLFYPTKKLDFRKTLNNSYLTSIHIEYIIIFYTSK